MLVEIRSVKLHYVRPPNPPRWKVSFRLPPDRTDRKMWPYAPDEMGAAAQVIRAYKSGHSDDQKTGT